MSTRHITKEQFSPNTTIDGARIAKVLDELEQRVNNVPLGDIEYQRAMQYMILNCLTAKTSSWNAAQSFRSPFNDAGSQDNAGAVINAGSEERAKGLITGDEAFPSAAAGNNEPIIAWTAATQFPKPVVIDTISIVLEADDDYETEWVGGTLFAANQWSQRVHLLIDTDDLVSSEDRTLNSVEFHLHSFDEQRWLAPLLGTTPATDMQPLASDNTYTATADGFPTLVLTRQGLNIPIHQLARVRFRVALVGSSPTPGAGFITESLPGRPTFVIAYKEALRG